MKAIHKTRYGPPEVLQLVDIETPVPQGNQVLVAVHAVSLNAMDTRGLRGRPYVLRPLTGGWSKPKNPSIGADLAGVVAATGPDASRFRPGDAVFGVSGGTLAEYALARETNLVLKPANRSFEEAAALPVAGLTALQGLRDAAQVRPGQQILIQGASGGVGSLAVALAKHYGAEVTAVCSPRNLDLARRLGADHVIDYTREDFTRSGRQYDQIFAVNGYHSIFAYRRALRPQGTYICAGGTILQFLQAMVLGTPLSGKDGKRLASMGIAKVTQEDLQTLAELLESGVLVPSIDATYPLAQTAAAVRYIEEQHPQGKVVVTITRQ